MWELTGTIILRDQQILIKLLYSHAEEYSFFSAAHRTFSKTDLKLEHREKSQQRKTEVTPCILTDHHRRLKLDINNKRNNRKLTNLRELAELKKKDQE